MRSTIPNLPRDEEVAQFRVRIIGHLTAKQLTRGQLAAELRALSQVRFRPPESEATTTYAVSTLERWYSAYRRGGLNALKPTRRKDAGRGRGLTPKQRDLLLAIRAEFPSAAAALIVRTLEEDGIFPRSCVSPQTVRRLYRQAHLPRLPRAQADGDLEEVRQRLRWEAPHVSSLWQGDVCHALKFKDASGKRHSALVHALIDDHSRFIVRLEVRPREREQDMLEILAHAVREHGRPDATYFDNGATYSGGILPIVCERLGIHLLHSRPGDAPSRGKIERLFRTMREQCIDHITGAKSLHDIYVRCLAWRDLYHRTPHASLMGRTPEMVWRQGVQSLEHQQRLNISEEQLQEAYVIRSTRRVRKDSTLSVGGKLYEVSAAWLGGKTVTLVRSCLAEDRIHVLFEDQRYAVQLADPNENAKRPRRTAKKRLVQSVPTGFNPVESALKRMLSRNNEEDRS